MEASNSLLIHVYANFFIFLACIVNICTYSMVSKHKAYLISGGNEGRPKSNFRQLSINTLWPSKGYVSCSGLITSVGEERADLSAIVYL